jgi:hypothetical protein
VEAKRPPKYRFWPERPPGPVDDAYAQTRWLRPYRPGLVRVLTSLFLLAVLGLVVQVALLTTFHAADPATLAIRIAVTVVLTGGLGLAFSRCYLSGVWVSDHKVRVLRPLSTSVWSWSELADVRSVAGPTRLLGSPLAVPGHQVLLVLADGRDVATPVTDRSADFLGRPQAYSMAADAVEGWFQLGRGRVEPGREAPGT